MSFTIIYDAKEYKVKETLRIKDFFHEYYNGDIPIMGGYLNNRISSLDTEINKDATLTPILFTTSDGRDIYRRSMCMVLSKAFRDIFPTAKLVIGHSLGNGYYYDYQYSSLLGRSELIDIQNRMKDIIKDNYIFENRVYQREKLIDILTESGFIDTLRLVNSINKDYISVYKLDELIFLDTGPMLPSTSYLKKFGLKVYPPGFILRFPYGKTPELMPEFDEQPKLFNIYHESKRWGNILGIDNIGKLNEVTRAGKLQEIIWIQEAFHEKKIAQIADDIAEKKDFLRLVLIAGPSSSGKTTFAKRLLIHLKTNGLKVSTLSLDNYFVNREQTPKDEEGKYDFEALEAIDLDLFNEHLQELLDGKLVEIPRFDFKTGHRIGYSETIQLDRDELLIIEGIHGLNEMLTGSILRRVKYKIYISALTQITIDNNNRIPTTDTRLIRRLVRDEQFRKISPKDTLAQWSSVRRGEKKHIFPYQDEADAMFNSALIYESAILKTRVVKLLKIIPKDSMHYSRVERLLRYIELVIPDEGENIPKTSILREFIGGSGFSY